jgi:lysyl-tRNA synthetase class 2
LAEAGPRWRPSAEIEILRGRAAILARLRAFFAERGVLEVETPALSAATVTDLHLHSLAAKVEYAGESRLFYLQTSPEFAMKRLLAAGSGPIFQLCRSFRDGESGRLHNPEFTMLEWYRPGYDHQKLMDEMADLLELLLGGPRAERKTYGEAFAAVYGIDPHAAKAEELAALAAARGIEVVGYGKDSPVDDWLMLLFSLGVEPGLGRGRPTFIYDYPASQAALARVADGRARRFEVYAHGIELANGFHELSDAAEQRRRFEADREERRRRGLPLPPIDENLLAALEAGLPDCAGVALGVDRLVMLALGKKSLAEVIAFPADRA